MKTPLFLATILVICTTSLLTAGETVIKNFTLTEHLGYMFDYEVIEFELDKPIPTDKRADLRLSDAADTLLPFQFVTPQRIALRTNLKALETKSFQLVQAAGKSTPQTDLKTTNSSDGRFLEIINTHTGMRIPFQKTDAMYGPLGAVRSHSGKWAGEGKLTLKEELVAYTAELIHNGPVFHEVKCTYTFAEEKHWTIYIRIIADEPAILLREESTLGAKSASVWTFNLANKFTVSHTLHRVCIGDKRVGRGGHALRPFATSGSVQLTAWFTWWSGTATTAAAFFALPPSARFERKNGAYVPLAEIPANSKKSLRLDVDEGLEDELDDLEERSSQEEEPAKPIIPGEKNDVFVVAVGRPAAWARDSENGISMATLPIQRQKDGLWLSMPLNRVGRMWLIGTGTVAQTIVPDNEVALPQKLYAKHLGTSLAMIQQMTLAWETKRFHPTLLFDQKTYENYPFEKTKNARMLWGSRGMIEKYYFNRTPDARTKGKEPTRKALLNDMENAISYFLPRDGACRHVAENEAPHEHGRAFMSSAAGTDFLLGTDAFTDDEKKMLRARLAFLAYRGSNPHLINHKKGLRNFPNMSISSYIGVGMCATVIADHPEYKRFAEFVETRIDRDLNSLAGPNGGWLECPHYQGASLDLLWYALAAKKERGISLAEDIRLRKAVRFLAKISTPRDPRFEQQRILPPIGNTYIYETSSQFGILAQVWKEKDPSFAETMQWMWQEHGLPEFVGIGGDVAIHWHSHMMLDPEWKAKQPLNLNSETFPLFGAVLRSHFPSNEETYFLYHIGPWLYHYDNDMGTFILWAKGQPLSTDWGYKGCMPAWQHNRVSLGSSGKMKAHAFREAADYAHGVQAGWHRQILFVKDKSSQGATWFFLRDWLEPKTRAGDWWYWLYTKEAPLVRNNMLLHKGTGNVDCDIWFAENRAEDFPRLTAKQAEMYNRPSGSKPPVSGLQPDVLSEDELVLDEDKAPAIERVAAKEVSIKCGASGKRGEPATTQFGIKLPITTDKPVTWVLYPRFYTDTPPTITSIANGLGVKVSHKDGVDYAFLGDKNMEWKDDTVSFSGTVGSVQIRNDSLTLTLSEAGEISCNKHTLKGEGGISKTFAE